jgi:hypothetical protein
MSIFAFLFPRFTIMNMCPLEAKLAIRNTFPASRRAFLGRASIGLGSLALSSMLRAEPAKSTLPKWDGVVKPLHLPAKAKRVIFLYMAGGPSQFETFDYKPGLARLDGKPMPASVTANQPIAQLQGQKLQCMRPLFPFKKWGKSGQEISTLFPWTGEMADDICIVRSMHTDQINHDPAHTVMNTGTSISGRPSMGSWITYGIGNECEDLPGFIVMVSTNKGRSPQPVHMRQWHNGFLPSRFQGVEFKSHGDPVMYLSNPSGVNGNRQRDVVDAVQSLNRLGDLAADDPDAATKIANYELAFRMQMSVPKLTDFRDEPESVLQLYGTRGVDGTFAGNCLLARRLAERGVRFIQLYHRDWDHHNDIAKFLPSCANEVDKPAYALITDLKRRGMLDETLILWSGEFGRTPMVQGNKGGPGRDHHMRSFSMWMAGGGIKGGLTHGATDEIGYHAVEKSVHVNDLHATMLHLLGIDHERLTYRFQGRYFRLTDISGHVVREVLA